MQKKLAFRLVIGLFVIAALIFGFNALQGFLQDPDTGTVESADWIAAIENLPSGSRAVVFDADGKKMPAPDWQEGNQDTEPVWRPDGHRVFFVSNRGDGNPPFNIFRWNLAKDRVEQRSLGSISKSSPTTLDPRDSFANEELLITAGGRVMSLNQTDGAMTQVLPPIDREVPGSAGEGGAQSQFQRLYEAIGDSFSKAVWGADRSVIFAKMRRDGGEVLIAQSLEVDENGATPPPVPLIAGKSINFDVAADGRAIASVQVFQFFDISQIPEEFIVDGEVIPPFRHVVALIDLEDTDIPLKWVVASNGDDGCFGHPAISPRSDRLVLPVGTYEEGLYFSPTGIVLLPMRESAQPVALLQGAISKPDWSPDARRIVFLKNEGGKRAIYTIGADGSGEKRVSDRESDYDSPVFSPQESD